MRKAVLGAVVAGLLLFTVPAWSGSHSWVVEEIFSDATGTIQFVELWCPAAFPNEHNIANKPIHSNAQTSPNFPANLPAGSTADTYLLIATAGFAALPGAPTPDLIMQDNFFSLTADTIQWHIYGASVLSFNAGQLPTDGVQSLDKNLNTGPATPTNFAGDSWSQPPGTSGMLVTKFPQFPDGSRLSLNWNDGVCLGALDHHVVYGTGSDLPATVGGTYTVGGGKCDIGASAPFVWAGVPPTANPGDLFWFLVVADADGAPEGSWGKDSNGNERVGPMGAGGGASGVCTIFTKEVANTCE